VWCGDTYAHWLAMIDWEVVPVAGETRPRHAVLIGTSAGQPYPGRRQAVATDAGTPTGWGTDAGTPPT